MAISGDYRRAVAHCAEAARIVVIEDERIAARILQDPDTFERACKFLVAEGRKMGDPRRFAEGHAHFQGSQPYLT